MHESKRECMKYHTQKIESISQAPPKSNILAPSLPLASNTKTKGSDGGVEADALDVQVR